MDSAKQYNEALSPLSWSANARARLHRAERERLVDKQRWAARYEGEREETIEDTDDENEPEPEPEDENGDEVGFDYGCKPNCFDDTPTRANPSHDAWNAWAVGLRVWGRLADELVLHSGRLAVMLDALVVYGTPESDFRKVQRALMDWETLGAALCDVDASRITREMEVLSKRFGSIGMEGDDRRWCRNLEQLHLQHVLVRMHRLRDESAYWSVEGSLRDPEKEKERKAAYNQRPDVKAGRSAKSDRTAALEKARYWAKALTADPNNALALAKFRAAKMRALGFTHPRASDAFRLARVEEAVVHALMASVMAA